MTDNVELQEPEHNHKLVKDSPLDRIKGDPYPFMSGHQTTNGELHLKVQHPEFPKASSEEKVSPDGSYEHTEYNEKLKGLTSSLKHHSRGYNSGGNSSQVDGHSDSSNESTKRTVTKGDTGNETGGDAYSGAGGKTIKGQKGDEVTISGGGQKIRITTNNSPGGDSISNYAGDTHENFEGDHIRSVNGNKYTMVKEGDFGVHVQDKNLDFQADSGKARIKTGSDITIESDTKITLKVGGSSIVLTPSGITINTSGKIDITSSGDITTKGSSTKVQGGGPVSPAVTFT